MHKNLTVYPSYKNLCKSLLQHSKQGKNARLTLLFNNFSSFHFLFPFNSHSCISVAFFLLHSLLPDSTCYLFLSSEEIRRSRGQEALTLSLGWSGAFILRLTRSGDSVQVLHNTFQVLHLVVELLRAVTISGL